MPTSLPDRFVNDFEGVQRNFEAAGSNLSRLQTQLTAANALIAAAQGSITTLQSNVTALQTQANTSTTRLGYTTTNSPPSATSVIELVGFRQITVTTDAGAASTSPLLATDSFVEVSGTTVGFVYLPATSAVPAGKMYTIRNNRVGKTITVRINATTTLVGHSTLAAGASLCVLNTGSAWRFMFVTGATKAGV